MKNYDVIIVGGGVIGKSIAIEVGKEKLKILIIDPSLKKCGSASYAAGAMLGAFAEITEEKNSEFDKIETKFRVSSARLYNEWLKEISQISEKKIFLNQGTFITANNCNKKDHINLKKIVETLEEYNEPYEFVSPNNIPGYKPHLNAYSNNAIFIPHEGYISTYNLMGTLDNAIQKKSNIDQMDDIVFQISQETCSLEVKTRNHGTLYSQYVILSAGFSIYDILKESNLNNLLGVNLFAGKGSSLIVESDILIPHVIRTPNRDFSCGAHVVPIGSNRFYLGATNRIESNGNLLNAVTAGEIHSLLNTIIHEINVNFRTSNIEKIQYGSRPLTTDGYPLIGKTEIDGLLIATGTYRNGILMAPLISKIITSELIGSTSFNYDNPFSPNNRPLKSKERNIENIIDEGVKHLVSFIQEPGGMLPYNRGEELEKFISILLKMTLTNNSYEKLINSSKKAIKDFPLSEVICKLFYEYNSTEINND